MAKKIYNSETGEVEEESGGKQLPVVEPIYALIDGFCETYKPCERERYADETFTIARIREYFKCYTIPDPKWVDLLPKYLDALEERGFKLRTSFCGEAAVFVQWQERPLEYDSEDEKERQKIIEEMADNYMRGRAMALSFKPLTLQDIKEAFLCGACDMEHLIVYDEDEEE